MSSHGVIDIDILMVYSSIPWPNPMSHLIRRKDFHQDMQAEVRAGKQSFGIILCYTIQRQRSFPSKYW